MSGIFDKLRIIGLSNVHTLLDRIIDMNSPGAVEQYLRDMNAGRDKVDASVTQSIARFNSLTQEQKKKVDRVSVLNSTIEHILTDDDPNNDWTAKSKMKEKLGIEGQLARINADLATESTTKGTLQEALGLIDSRISELEARLETLRSTEHQSAGKEEAANALKAARQILDKAPGSSIDNALQRAEQRDSVANVALEREVARLKETSSKAGDDVEVDAALAEFKKNLAKKPSVAA